MPRRPVVAKTLDIAALTHDVVFSLADFMGDPARVKATLESRGLELSLPQIEAMKRIFADGKVLDPVGPVAGVYETCGPQSKTKICF